mmetsp:Transcript_29637/g.52897  ORF Transcript_29637/g.52897 Transcript_29637/m.52897 type:complete len:136 (-) Transcript_29637:1217-1624(-)
MGALSQRYPIYAYVGFAAGLSSVWFLPAPLYTKCFDKISGRINEVQVDINPTAFKASPTQIEEVLNSNEERILNVMREKAVQDDFSEINSRFNQLKKEVIAAEDKYEQEQTKVPVEYEDEVAEYRAAKEVIESQK